MTTLWTTIDDVKKRWAKTAPVPYPDDEQLEIYIEDIEAQILGRFPRLQERLNNNTLSIIRVKSAVSHWIMEYVQTGANPYSQESQSYTGAVARSVTYDSRSRKTLLLTDSDLDLFMPANQGKAFSLSMTPENTRMQNVWYVVWEADEEYYKAEGFDDNPWI